MNGYLEVFKLTMLPTLAVILTGIASAALLMASQLMVTDEGEYHLAGLNYSFNPKDYLQAFFVGGAYALIFLYIMPMLITGEATTNWVPILIISLLVVQSFIDIKYHELANEWTALLGALIMFNQWKIGELTSLSILIAFVFFALFFISWFLFDLPGFGDVKLVLVGGMLLNSWTGAYYFLFLVFLIAILATIIDAISKKIPIKEWLSLKFAFGPYLAFGLIAALAGVF